MKEFYDCLITTNGMAYGTGVLIFLITLLLVSKRVIGFTLTLILLLLAIGASMAVSHQNDIRNYINGLSHPKNGDNAYKGAGSANAEQKEVPLSDQLSKAYEDLKAEFEIQKNKLQEYMNKGSEKAPAENPAPAANKAPAKPSQTSKEQK